MEPSAAAAAAGGERTFLSNAQKLQLRAFWAANAALKPAEVSAWALERFGCRVGRATLYRISRAPESAFSGGRASAKKPRRVKFPEFERELLVFCEHRRGLRRRLTDEELLREAAEIRERLGIHRDELKLSNGWLHSFKERHELRAPVRPKGMDEEVVGNAEDLENSPVMDEKGGSRQALVQGSEAPVVAGTEGRLQRKKLVQQNHRKPQKKTARPTTKVAEHLGSRQLQQPTRTMEQNQQKTSRVAPLLYISAKAVSSVQTKSFFNWDRVGGMLDSELFAVVNNGICVLRGGIFQINVDIVHNEATGEVSSSSGVVFKVWKDDMMVLGECSSRLQQENGIALSAFQLQTTISTNSVIRVEFLAPGFAFHSSRLVVKLVSDHQSLLAPPSVATLTL